ncbi:MAG: aminotransferase-like domain-containing protein [Planctomycetota bacterium]
MEFPLSSKGERAAPQPISYLMAQGVSGGCISLAAGLVDADSLPAEEVNDVVCRLVAGRGRIPLQYGTTEGLRSLREKVKGRLCRADGVSPADLPLERVLLSTGSQQMLYILTEILVDPGDIVITPAPTYFVYLGTLQTAGARVRGVPIDGEGMRVDALREALEEIEATGEADRVKLVYIASYFQNPSGVSLSVDRRKALVETVKSFKSMRPLIIEDAAYRELRFEGDDTRSIWSFDEGGERVAHLGTFSKPLSPGLRTGFAVIPEALIEKATIVKGNHDFGSANFSQHVIDLLVESGFYDRHVERLRETYRGKCDLMCECLQRGLGPAARWTKPGGGLYVWVDLGRVDTGMNGPFFRRCAENGVLYVPGEFAYPEGYAAPLGQMRLSFGPSSADDIREGVARLASSVEPVSV